MKRMSGKAVAGWVLKIAAMAAAAAALLAAGYELGARSVSPIERLEASGKVIDGGPIRAAAEWRM